MRSVKQHLLLTKPVFLTLLRANVYRVSKENRILTGLWYKSFNPDMLLFLRPVAESLKKLNIEGSCSWLYFRIATLCLQLYIRNCGVPPWI